MVKIDWPESYRIVYSRYPFTGIFDRIADPAELEGVAELEARTNDRILDEVGALALVRPSDRIAGPGATPIMASFTHSKPSRFSDGAFGMYYAAKHLSTAISESTYHVGLFYRATAERSADIDMRVYEARIRGKFDDLRFLPTDDPRLDPQSYAASQRYGASLHASNELDGIVYPSVREEKRRVAVGCFRPRVVSNCRSHMYLLYRWDGMKQSIVEVIRRETLGG
jgi:RES domain-containing protein